MKKFVALVLGLLVALAPLASAGADGGREWITGPCHADIMLIACHPDDDQLFLGAIIPTYAQRGKSVVTVFMTDGNHPMRPNAAKVRPTEARNGLWTVGERIAPVFGKFRDSRFHSMESAKKCWPDAKVTAFLVEQIRKYTPTVIVSQDVNGEYGHIAHKWMVQEVRKAFRLSGDPSCCPESAEKYGVWNPLKLFLHLYEKNKIVLDTDVPLPMFGGKTAFEMAKIGYKCHKSQQNGHHAVSEKKYSIRKFGLALSRVGYSVKSGDLFESVNLYTMFSANPDIAKVARTQEFESHLAAHGFPLEMVAAAYWRKY